MACWCVPAWRLSIGLVDQRVQGSDLVLTFGLKGSTPAAPKSFSLPQAQPSAEQPRMMPAAAPVVDAMQHSAAAPAGMALGDALSSAAGTGGMMPEPHVGLGGAPQGVPSVEQILSMAKQDAQRYGQNAASRADQYGTYEMPAFDGEDQQLSDVRVSLNARRALMCTPS